MNMLAQFNPQRWKIHTKIFALLLGTIFLSTLILSGNSYYSLSTKIEDQNGITQLKLGKEIYQHYADLMKININNALTLSQMSEVMTITQLNGALGQEQIAFSPVYNTIMRNLQPS